MKVYNLVILAVLLLGFLSVAHAYDENDGQAFVQEGNSFQESADSMENAEKPGPVANQKEQAGAQDKKIAGPAANQKKQAGAQDKKNAGPAAKQQQQGGQKGRAQAGTKLGGKTGRKGGRKGRKNGFMSKSKRFAKKLKRKLTKSVAKLQSKLAHAAKKPLDTKVAKAEQQVRKATQQMKQMKREIEELKKAISGSGVAEAVKAVARKAVETYVKEATAPIPEKKKVKAEDIKQWKEQPTHERKYKNTAVDNPVSLLRELTVGEFEEKQSFGNHVANLEFMQKQEEAEAERKQKARAEAIAAGIIKA